MKARRLTGWGSTRSSPRRRCFDSIDAICGPLECDRRLARTADVVCAQSSGCGLVPPTGQHRPASNRLQDAATHPISSAKRLLRPRRATCEDEPSPDAVRDREPLTMERAGGVAGHPPVDRVPRPRPRPSHLVAARRPGSGSCGRRRRPVTGPTRPRRGCGAVATMTVGVLTPDLGNLHDRRGDPRDRRGARPAGPDRPDRRVDGRPDAHRPPDRAVPGPQRRRDRLARRDRGRSRGARPHGDPRSRSCWPCACSTTAGCRRCAATTTSGHRSAAGHLADLGHIRVAQIAGPAAVAAVRRCARTGFADTAAPSAACEVSAPATSPTHATAVEGGGAGDGDDRRRRRPAADGASSPTTMRWRSASTRRSRTAGCAVPTTSPSSAFNAAPLPSDMAIALTSVSYPSREIGTARRRDRARADRRHAAHRQ